MNATRNLSKHPTALTAVLSVAAIAGYVAYRFTLGGTDDPTDLAAILDHDHDGVEGADDMLPGIVLRDLAGSPTSLSSLAGEPLLINFWATWCAPCLREIPMLKAFHEDNPSVRVVGIAVDDADKVAEYASRMEFNYPILIGVAEGMEAMAYLHNDAGAMPFSVFTAADGTVLGNHAGELHPEHLETLSATLAELTSGAIDESEARERLADLF